MNILPAFENRNIPLIFSSSDYFVPYMSVMMRSVAENASEQNNYDVIVLHSEISAENQAILSTMLKPYKNFSLRFFDVGEYFEPYRQCTKNPKLFSAIYYRLLAPFIMSAYDRAIYLDGDMVADTDVAPLLHIELDDCFVAAVRDYNNVSDLNTPGSDRRSYEEQILKLEKAEDYFITGLLVLNLKKCRDCFSLETILELAASYEWRLDDQDILNMLTQKHTLLLNGRWNALQNYGYHKYMPKELYAEWKRCFNAPLVAHFGGSGKPWRYPRIPRAKLFWKYAKESPYYTTIIERRNAELKTDRRYLLEYLLYGVFPIGSWGGRWVKRVVIKMFIRM